MALRVPSINGDACRIKDIAGPGRPEDADFTVAPAVDIRYYRSAIGPIADDRQKFKRKRSDLGRPARTVGVVIRVFARIGRPAAVQRSVRVQCVEPVVPARLIEGA